MPLKSPIFAKLTGEKISEENGEISLVKNKLVEWHTYKDEFKTLKKQASVVITRNAESFTNIITPQDAPISVPRIIKVEAKPFTPSGDNELVQLRNLEVPNASIDSMNNDEPTIFLPTRPYSNTKKKAEEEEVEDDVAENMMSNLSQFFKKRE